MTEHDPIPPDAMKARIRTFIMTERRLTPEEFAEWQALTLAYRALRHAAREPQPPPYRGVNPNRYPPFSCSQCGTELRPRQPHGILERARILCDPCLARDDSPVLVLATDRAGAVAWLDQHGLIDPTYPTHKKETK